MPRSGSRRTPTPRWLPWVIAFVIIVAALLIGRAASSGIDLVTDGLQPGPSATAGPVENTESRGVEGERPPGESEPGLGEQIPPEAREVVFRLLDAVLIVTAILFIIGLVVLISRIPDGGPEPEDWPDPLGVPDPLRLREAVREGLLLRDDPDRLGSPRNAIVAAWAGVEEAGHRVGIPRHPAETTSEYVPRLLTLAGVPAEPVSTLSALYLEARFSEHHLGPAAVSAATDALAAIAAALGTPAPEPR